MPTYTFVESCPTDKDTVRSLVGDTVMANPMMSDEEIQAAIDRQTCAALAVPYYAGAEVLAILHTRWMTAGRGRASKKVSQLQVVYGTGSGINIDLAVQARVTELRKEAARRNSKAGGRSFSLRMA